AYVLAEATDANDQAITPKLILMGTGSEVSLTLDAREQLQAEGIPTRVVAMPCWELFEEQSKEYREEVLPIAVKARVAIEAGVSQVLERDTGPSGSVVALDRFGASAPGDVALRELGFTVENLIKHAKEVL